MNQCQVFLPKNWMIPGDFDLLVVDQDLDKDRHIWGKVFGDTVTASIQKLSMPEVIRHMEVAHDFDSKANNSMGGLDFLLQFLGSGGLLIR